MMLLPFNDDFILYRKSKRNKDFLSSSNYFSTHFEDRILPHTFVSTQNLTLAGEKHVGEKKHFCLYKFYV